MTRHGTALTVGVIGMGRMGRMRAELLARHGSVSRVVVADIDAERLAEVAAGLERAGTVAELFRKRVDAVVVAVPTAAHAGIVRQSLERQIPCFCEKPLALRLDETRRLRDLARSTGVPLQVGFHRRFDPGIRRARAQALAGELGTLRRLHLISADKEPPPPGFLAGSGGLLTDLSIHDFDLARWFTGRDVVSVYAARPHPGAPALPPGADDHNAVCVLTLSGGVLATVHASRDNGGGQDVRLEAAGTLGTVTAGLGPKTPLRYADDACQPQREPQRQPWSGFLERFASAYEDEMDAFVRHVTGVDVNPCTAVDAYEALRIACAADESLRTGLPVAVGPDRGEAVEQGRR
jgi:myo-inositol 2-dehydrogenase/D-chiro-inositol 1-dehydrogenase